MKQKAINEQTKQTDRHNSTVVTRGEGGEGRMKRVNRIKHMVTED